MRVVQARGPGTAPGRSEGPVAQRPGTPIQQRSGEGAPAHPYHAAGYNGPVLRPEDRRGISDGPNLADQTFDVAVLQANWDLGAQLLSYVGAYAEWDSKVGDPLDDGNFLPGAEVYQQQAFINRRTTHEVRMASMEPLFERFDYTVGAFYAEQTVNAAGDIEVDLGKRLVKRNGNTIALTRTEWQLLQHLAANPGKVILSGELLAKVWGPEYRDDLQYLRVWVSRLRQKLELDPSNPEIIKTLPGIGYMFQAVAQEA